MLSTLGLVIAFMFAKVERELLEALRSSLYGKH